MSVGLNAASLASLPPAIRRPPVRSTVAPGVVHLGLGAFHRAHQAVVYDALAALGDDRWGVFGVAMRSPDLVRALRAQDHYYAVEIASRAESWWQVIGALRDSAVAATEPQRVVEAMAAPSTRWITLTVTEKAYNPALAQFIVQGLHARQARGLPGVTVASCDNLSSNGDQLRTLCLEAARAISPSLATWVDQQCRFPNSMVDRIVPQSDERVRLAARQALGVEDLAPLSTEGFWEWAIERSQLDAADAAALASVGVMVVDDVKAFEEAKLRMLNGVHSAIACIGAVVPQNTVRETVSLPWVREFVRGFLDEVAPVVRRPNTDAYRDALLTRFVNPALHHRCHQIAQDGSVKITQRWVPATLALQALGKPTPYLIMATACWLRYWLAQDEQGQAYDFNDPYTQPLQALVAASRDDGDWVDRLLHFEPIWGTELPRASGWLAAVRRDFDTIQAQGIQAAVSGLAT